MKTLRKNLILSLALLCFAASPLCAKAFAVTQGEIDAIRSRRDAIAAERRERQAAVDELVLQRAGVLEQKAAMDERSALMLEQIELTRQEIALYGEQIEEKRLEVEQTGEQERIQLARYRSRVRAMEENGRLNILTLILHTGSLGEFFTTADDIGEIMRYDRALEDAYRLARENSDRAKAEYEAAKAELERKEAQLSAEQDTLRAEIREAEALIAGLGADIENRQAEVRAVQAAEAEAEAELQRLMAELERQRREEEERRRREEEERRRALEQARLEQEAREREQAQREQEEQARREQEALRTQTPAESAVGSGSFLWPVPGHSYVTSRFGLRVHPITGQKKSHTGLDIPAELGTEVVAADSGTVRKAAVYGSYGNCVILDHGNGYATLYAHLSRIAVGEGETVSRGQSIGAVGSTGLSTGPHCHFEIWSGGSRIDPEPFFSGLSFAESAGE